jgi:hypothetical protein
VALAAFLFALATVTVSGAALAGGDETRLRAELIAAAAAGDVSGKAEFRDRRSRRKFSVEVEGFNAGEMFDVMVGVKTVGKIVIDAAGFGNLDFDDTAGPGDADDPFPTDFPALDGGEAVTVGPLAGSLQPK